MSDQTSPPPKPKPGSLRDRIAAFEKSSATSAPAPAPAPRPKPAGFSSWKPKPPSRPSSPPNSEPAPAAQAGMSASDAKDSIAKAGSLKERMAALQGRGAFGAPPAVAPKPSVERPKWKPPPAVSPPVDDDDHPTKEPAESVEAAIQRSISPPIAPKPAELAGRSSRKSSVDISFQPPSGDGDETSAPADPEEEERQRRAALAAKMARLGGARVGMAPPMIGKKPIRKPTQEEQPVDTPTEQPTVAVAGPELTTPEDHSTIPAETPNMSLADVTSSPEQRRQSSDYFKDSDDAVTHSPQSKESTKSPSSMPMTTVPRRTGPPRKKPAKASAPSEVPEEKLTEDVPPLETTPTLLEDIASKGLSLTATSPEESETSLASSGFPPIHQEAREVSPETKDREHNLTSATDVKSTGPLSSESAVLEVEPSPKPSLESSTDQSNILLPPSHDIGGGLREEVDSPSLGRDVLQSSSELVDQLDTTTALEESDAPTPVGEVVGEELDEAGEEEARKKRVTERLASMGGINPFTPQPQRAAEPPLDHDTHLNVDTQASVVDSTPVDVEGGGADIHSKGVEDVLDEVESEGSIYEPEVEAEHIAHIHENAEDTSNKSPEPPATPLVLESPPPIPSNRPPSRKPTLPPTDVVDSAEYQPRSHPSRQASLASEADKVSSPPRQSQPPRRIVPQTPSASDDAGEREEEDEHSDEEARYSVSRPQRYVPPPAEQHVVPHPRRRFIQDEEDVEGNGSENDSPALPVRQRRSVEIAPSRSVPAPPADEYSETESDHDGQALPIPPRRVASPPTIISSPPPIERHLESISLHEQPNPTTLSVRQEILDEEEGDPIDPNFHSPSRRASFADISQAAQTQSPPAPVSPPLRSPPAIPAQLPTRKQTDPSSEGSLSLTTKTHEDQNLENAEQERRKTIAERMAKLGGIKFGAAPPVPVQRPTPAAPSQGHDQLDDPAVESAETERPLELTEEDEERARKGRIAAKLANMGGMRIGMMPMGMAAPQRSHILRDEPTSPPPVSSPPPRLPPAPELESESASVTTSDDIVKVDAEESEAEDVSYQEAKVEEPPPPVPSRAGRQAHRRESTDTPSSPPPPGRPPVPAPHRRASVQSTTTDRKVSLGKEPSHIPPSDYVMVEEGEAPPLPPGRHVPKSPPPSGVPSMAASQEISNWEMPEFESHGDLALSWTDAGEISQPPVSTHTSQQAPPKQPKTQPVDKVLSVDDLMAIWGRVGVQVCEVATALFDKSKKTLVGDGTYVGFIKSVLADVPTAANGIADGHLGYLIYSQSGHTVQKRTSEIMPGDIVELQDAKLKGHKGLQAYQQTVGSANESVIGIIGEFEAKKSKVKAFQANQHVGQQTVESVSYRLEDLKSGTVKIYRVLEA